MRRIVRILILLQDLARGILYRLFRAGIRSRARRMILPLADQVPRGAGILDIGAGTGDIGEQLRSVRGARPVHLDRGRIRFFPAPRPLVLCDGHRLAFRDAAFDRVLLVTVLHHCTNQREILREAKRVLRDGGRILVVEDVFESRWQRWTTVFHDAALNLEVFGHPRRFRAAAAWEAIFAEEGLAVESRRTFPFEVLWIFRFRDVLYVLRPEPETALTGSGSRCGSSGPEAGRPRR